MHNADDGPLAVFDEAVDEAVFDEAVDEAVCGTSKCIVSRVPLEAVRGGAVGFSCCGWGWSCGGCCIICCFT